MSLHNAPFLSINHSFTDLIQDWGLQAIFFWGDHFLQNSGIPDTSKRSIIYSELTIFEMSTSNGNASMSNKYAKDFAVPPEFPDVLSNLTREILRLQPQDIDKFGECSTERFARSMFYNLCQRWNILLMK